MKELLPLVREILSTTPDRWRALTAGVDRELLGRRPAPGEWSAIECLSHLAETEVNAFPVRVRQFLAGEDLTAFDPDAAGSRPEPGDDVAALATRFAARRTENLRLLESVTDADFERAAVHPELGQVTLREMLNEWVAHDLMHTVQAERALMQPFIVGSGRWRSYFADHEARP